MLFDTHCHLTSDAFEGDRDAAVERARKAGVTGIVTVASTPEDADAALELAARHDDVWSTAGVHPHESGSVADAHGIGASAGSGESLRRALGERLDRPGVVAVGECGLDFHYDISPRGVQRRILELHVELAAETGLPLVLHARDADEELIAVLRAIPDGVRGVVHCFTGSDALLETALAAGFHVSFTGIVSFRGYGAGHQVRAVPRDRIMVETDAPYLAPVPHRGKRNEPAFVGGVAEAVARHREESPEEVIACTGRNARRFYGLPDPEGGTGTEAAAG